MIAITDIQHMFPFSYGEFQFKVRCINEYFPKYKDDKDIIWEEFNKVIDFNVENKEFEIIKKEVTFLEQFSSRKKQKRALFSAKFLVRCYCNPKDFKRIMEGLLVDEGFEVFDYKLKK